MSSEPTREITPVDLLEKAQAGDSTAREHLLGWAYVTAHTYYRKKSDVEAALSVADAEDLASAFYLEFARAWPRIRAVYHYTRRMLKNNLHRHLVRSRVRRGRETILPQSELLRRFEARETTLPRREQDWSDGELLKHRIIGRVVEAADPRTRELVRYRCADPCLAYSEISEKTGASEAALRMRMARFYETVRRTHALAETRIQSNRRRYL